MFSVLFLAISKLCLEQNEQNFANKSKRSTSKPCFSFSFRKPKEATLFFWTRSFQKSSFCFLDKVFDKKGVVFFPLTMKNCFLFLFTNVQLGNTFKSFNRVFNKKTLTQITNNYLVSGCLENSHFSITKMTRWVGLQKELNCSLPN